MYIYTKTVVLRTVVIQKGEEKFSKVIVRKELIINAKILFICQLFFFFRKLKIAAKDIIIICAFFIILSLRSYINLLFVLTISIITIFMYSIVL